jgi:cytochrome c oxidase subunit IV
MSNPNSPSDSGRPIDDHISTSPHTHQAADAGMPVRVSPPAKPAMSTAEYLAAGTFHDEDPTHYRMYVGVFAALCVATFTSFLVNQLIGAHNPTLNASLIAAVSIVKAGLVAWIFMHLAADWRRVYGIMLPVVIMAVMMTIILSIDAALVWHHLPGTTEAAAAAPAAHH